MDRQVKKHQSQRKQRLLLSSSAYIGLDYFFLNRVLATIMFFHKGYNYLEKVCK